MVKSGRGKPGIAAHQVLPDAHHDPGMIGIGRDAGPVAAESVLVQAKDALPVPLLLRLVDPGEELRGDLVDVRLSRLPGAGERRERKERSGEDEKHTGLR